MSHQDGFGNNRSEPTGSTKPDDDNDGMQKKSENVAHAEDGIRLKKLKNSGNLRNSPPTGMRKGECSSLTWSDVEGDALTLRGEHSKNGEARTIPLAGELAEIIARRKAVRRVKVNGLVEITDLIFYRIVRGQVRPVYEFKKSWATACKKAGLPGRIFHDLRRSAVRDMTHAGVPQGVAMRISGHKTASMFQRYNIVVTEDMRTALEKTEQYRAATAKRKVVAMR